MKILVFAVVALAAIPGWCQSALPPAPTDPCSFDSAPASTPVRLLLGTAPVPYNFACGVNRPAGVCVSLPIKPGIVVSVGAEKSGWTCITGGDSTSGWVPSTSLGELPTTPRISPSAWIGWWQQGKSRPGMRNDRLLITKGDAPNSFHVSGRAYWYGLNDNVHLGEVKAEGFVVGPYMHIIEGDELSGCVIDLKYDVSTRQFSAYDNQRCGGANVRFGRTWTKFTPSTTRSQR
ncbi:hypothetical protein RBB79_11935 [Tunturiibacter empetritectus]|uniref:SH3 domain-containing protein n=2 Tax=Tunturiibacter TaxID=3154218 RepID=A0A852VIL4_9BACT|nr:hypothetical protein [Edaphobacter lichenicola]NYF90294.1 hypothetical protein [Edaphobacter lichenicola]